MLQIPRPARFTAFFTSSESRPAARITVPVVGVLLLVLILPFLPYNLRLLGQETSERKNLLRISAQGELNEFWQVQEATLHQDVTGTMGSLEVENNSGPVLDNAIFYVEYFDAAGRFCFSLVFSQERDIGEQGPIAPAEVRNLYSVGAGLALGSEPNEARVYLVRRSAVAAEAGSLREWSVPMRAPVTVSGNMIAGQEQLRLDSDIAAARAPLSDLVLARVSVDQEGVVRQVDILNSVSKEAESWFSGFVRQQAFFPATLGGVPEPGNALFLLRVIPEQDSILEPRLITQPSSWVESYVGQITGTDVPPVTEIIFRRPPTKVKRIGMGSTDWTERPPAPTGLFQALFAGTEWSSPAVRLVHDPSAPHHLRAELPPPNLH